MFKRIWTVFIARNREFYRDKAGLGWNILFPIFIIIGFSLMFRDDHQIIFKAGIVKGETSAEYYQKFRSVKYIEFVEFSGREEAEAKLHVHKIDILVDPARNEYLTNSLSPKGYVAEIVLRWANSAEKEGLTQKNIARREIPYVEWLFPGILAMNMMFSALFGVGYVIVRYRKNGVLKRFSVTPLRAHEFLTAQIISRLFVILLTTSVIFFPVSMIFGFTCEGSILDLYLLFMLSAFAMISLGILIASRNSNEELADGVLNLISWPMMFLSEVWFSLEGTAEWVKVAAKFFPLTYLTDGARRIMNEGASLYDIRFNLLVLALMSVVFLTAGSLLFRWDRK